MVSETKPGPRLVWVNQYARLPGDAGDSRHFELGRELVRKGWQVTLAASDLDLKHNRYGYRDGPQDRRRIVQRVDGVEAMLLWAYYYQRNDWRRAMNWLTFYHSVTGLDQCLQADVVIGSSPQLFAAAAGARLARKIGVPFVFEVRDLWPESLVAAGGRRGPLYWLLERVANTLYARADLIIVLAEGVREYLAERGIPRDKLVFVPNGVDPAMFGGVEPAAARDNRDRFTLVYAGAHGPANGLEAVLDAAEQLRDEPRVRFLLVGGGPAKEGLRADARRRGLAAVEFHDPIPKAEIPALFREADAGLMILRDAPLFAFGVSPNKLFDYLAAGLPVVNNVPGEVAGWVERSGAGVQARNASGPALADAIREMLARPASARAAMGEAGRAWVRAHHSRAVLAERLHQALAALVLSHA